MGRALAKNNSAKAQPIKAGGTCRRQGEGAPMFCKIQDTAENATVTLRLRRKSHT
jgi:hypothetical protein